MTIPCATSALDWHSDDPAVQEACKAVCGGCPDRETCLDDALTHEDPWGVWGGLTGSERAELLAARFLLLEEYVEEHGTRDAYCAGCHCGPCTAANSAYIATWRATHTPAPAPEPVEPPLSLFDDVAVTSEETIYA